MSSELLYQLDERDRERVFAWARYVFWADVECRQYEAYEALENEPVTGFSFVLMVQWYAALWVTIEGWRVCRLSDATVDELLNDSAFEPNMHLLRRLRNAVYHYQDTLTNDRLSGFLHEATNTAPWAFLVHSEFQRVLWNIAHPGNLPVGVQDEIAEGIRQIIGWLPSDIPEAAPHEAVRRYQEVASLILKDGRRDTQEAADLISAADHFRAKASESATDWARWKRAMINTLKRRGMLA